MVLPSVERETIDLTSPRHSIHGQPSQSATRPVSHGYASVPPPKRRLNQLADAPRLDSYGHQSKRLRPMYQEDTLALRAGPMQGSKPAHPSSFQPVDYHHQPRAQPPQPVIDLTSSPRRPPDNGDGMFYSSQARAAPGPSGLPYVPFPSQGTSVRDPRSLQYEVHAGGQPRGHMPNSGMYQRTAPPVHDYIPAPDEHQRRPVYEEGSRYLTSGLHYGGPNVH